MRLYNTAMNPIGDLSIRSRKAILKVDAHASAHISQAIRDSIWIAKELECTVKLNFNGRKIYLAEYSDASAVERAYLREAENP